MRSRRWASAHRGEAPDVSIYVYYKIKKAAVRSRIPSKLMFASCVGYFDRAYYRFYLTSSGMLVVTEEDKV